MCYYQEKELTLLDLIAVALVIDFNSRLLW